MEWRNPAFVWLARLPGRALEQMAEAVHKTGSFALGVLAVPFRLIAAIWTGVAMLFSGPHIGFTPRSAPKLGIG